MKLHPYFLQQNDRPGHRKHDHETDKQPVLGRDSGHAASVPIGSVRTPILKRDSFRAAQLGLSATSKHRDHLADFEAEWTSPTG
jgi:hypothetical protein